jgi:hypothetical protein
VGERSESCGKEVVLESESEEVNVSELCVLDRFRESDDRSAAWPDRQKDRRFICFVPWQGKV